MEIEKFARALANGDTASFEKKTPFLKAKEVRAEFEVLKNLENGRTQKRGDALLRKILASLAKGRADDQRAVAETARQLVESGLYGSDS